MSDWEWIKVGSNAVYGAIIEGRVEAIVYWTNEELGSDEGGEPIVTSPGWFWFAANETGEHWELTPGPVLPEGEGGTLDPVHDAALEAAEQAINHHFGLG